MQYQHDYQCDACGYYLSDPVDQCPVCSDRFYWLLETKDLVSREERRQFVAEMVAMGGIGNSEQFLTHGEHLWLPPSFWETDAEGTMLTAYPWIIGLKLFQHEQQEPQRTQTIGNRAVLEADTASMPTIDPQRLPQADGRQEATNTLGKPRNRTKAKPQVLSARDETASGWPGQLLAPVAIFLFFVMLSLSYVTLRIQGNAMANTAYVVDQEVGDEGSILP